jgi:hypothetical protein
MELLTMGDAVFVNATAAQGLGRLLCAAIRHKHTPTFNMHTASEQKTRSAEVHFCALRLC